MSPQHEPVVGGRFRAIRRARQLARTPGFDWRDALLFLTSPGMRRDFYALDEEYLRARVAVTRP